MFENTEEKSRLQQALERLKNHFRLRSESFSEDKRLEIEAELESLQASVDQAETAREASARMTSRMSQIHEELPTNVIPFRRPQINTGGISKVEDKRWILRIDCLIESPYISEIHKMAMELHGHSQRYAFVEFRDLSTTTRRDTDELLKLGGISLFIPSILDLTPDEQGALARICQMDTIHRPLLMVGSSLSYSQLRGEPGLNADLLSCLTRAYIKLTRPFREYKDQGLIQYFLDSLSTSPT